MILVTHDLGVVAGRAHDIAVMYAGQIVEKAPATTLFANVRHPYTEALLRSIPKLDMAKHTRLDAISGRPPDLVNLPSGCKFAARCPYAQERCLNEEPALTPDPVHADHSYACHYPVGLVAHGAPPVAVPTADPLEVDTPATATIATELSTAAASAPAGTGDGSPAQVGIKVDGRPPRVDEAGDPIEGAPTSEDD
jgi:oligopeptide/dipeptide ABC transporter ATP-binding protein